MSQDSRPTALGIPVSRRAFIGTSAVLAAGVRSPFAPLRRYRLLMNSGPSGPLAYMFLADERGYLAAGDVAIDFVGGDGAAAIVPRVIKEGFDFGYGDFGALIHLAATDPVSAPVAIYMAFNQTPLTIAVAANGPIRTWRDLEGRTVLGHPTDAALVMFPALAHAAGINASRVTIEKSPASMRALNERMLKGEVDGVFGFVNTIIAALAPAGITRSALRFLEYRDHLPDLCGNVLMVKKSLLRERPADVRAVVRAFNRGLTDTVANIDDAMDALTKREPSVRRDVDKARLAGTLHVEMNHQDLAQLGAGDVDDTRVARSITAITASATYAHRPTVRDLFVRSALPARAERVRMMSPKVRMLLNSGFTGANAWIALAQDRGYFQDVGMDIEFTPGVGAYTAAPRMTDEGFDCAYGDINSLVEVVAATPRRAPLGVMCVFDRTPSTIAVLSTSPIRVPKDLERQVIVGHPTDVALRTFGAYASATGIDAATVAVRTTNAGMGDMIKEMRGGTANAMFGYVTTITAAARSIGLDPGRDIRFLPFRDVVPDLYGSAVMVSQGLAKHRPALVQALVAGMTRGLRDTIADPDAAIAALVKRDANTNATIERERLIGTLMGDVGADARAAVLGDVADARFARAVALLARTNALVRAPRPAEVFSRAFLPPAAARRAR